MVIEQRMVGRVAILELSGKLALGDGDGLLTEKMHALVREGTNHVLLNLGGLSYMDSAGLGELVRALATARKADGQIMLFNISKRVETLLAVTRVISTFDVFDNEDAALKKIGVQ